MTPRSTSFRDPLVDRGDGQPHRLAQLGMRGAPVRLKQRHQLAVDGVEFGHGGARNLKGRGPIPGPPQPRA